MSEEEDKELQQIWSYFKDLPEDVREKRQKLTTSINENELSAFPMGGQVKNYYRYGSILYCEKQREKLWFALRHGLFFTEKPLDENSSIREIENGRKIQQFYKNQLMKQKAHGSSEDVWNMREKPLVNPFKEE